VPTAGVRAAWSESPSGLDAGCGGEDAVEPVIDAAVELRPAGHLAVAGDAVGVVEGDELVWAGERSGETIDALARLASQVGASSQVVDRLREEYDDQLAVLRARDEDTDGNTTLQHHQAYADLGPALLHVKREAVPKLRDESRIDDIVLGQIQVVLDDEELWLNGRNASG